MDPSDSFYWKGDMEILVLWYILTDAEHFAALQPPYLRVADIPDSLFDSIPTFAAW